MTYCGRSKLCLGLGGVCMANNRFTMVRNSKTFYLQYARMLKFCYIMLKRHYVLIKNILYIFV